MAETSWNYRAVRTHTDNGPMWELHEVYYEEGRPTMRTAEPTTFTSDDGPDDIIDALHAALGTLQEYGVLDDAELNTEE